MVVSPRLAPPPPAPYQYGLIADAGLPVGRQSTLTARRISTMTVCSRVTPCWGARWRQGQTAWFTTRHHPQQVCSSNSSTSDISLTSGLGTDDTRSADSTTRPGPTIPTTKSDGPTTSPVPPPITSPVPPPSPPSSSPPIGAIVGGVVGGVAVIALFALGLVLLLRKRRRRQGPGSDPYAPIHPPGGSASQHPPPQPEMQQHFQQPHVQPASFAATPPVMANRSSIAKPSPVSTAQAVYSPTIAGSPPPQSGSPGAIPPAYQAASTNASPAPAAQSISPTTPDASLQANPGYHDQAQPAYHQHNGHYYEMPTVKSDRELRELA